MRSDVPSFDEWAEELLERPYNYQPGTNTPPTGDVQSASFVGEQGDEEIDSAPRLEAAQSTVVVPSSGQDEELAVPVDQVNGSPKVRGRLGEMKAAFSVAEGVGEMIPVIGAYIKGVAKVGTTIVEIIQVKRFFLLSI